MALVVGENTWGTVTEADTYLTYKTGVSAWFDLSDTGDPGTESKESLLASAFYWLLYDSLYGLSASLTIDAVKIAQFEAAMFLLNNRIEYESRDTLIASGVKSFDRSKWSETLDAVKKPASVDNILRSAGFGSANGTALLLGEDYDTDETEGIDLIGTTDGVIGYD